MKQKTHRSKLFGFDATKKVRDYLEARKQPLIKKTKYYEYDNQSSDENNHQSYGSDQTAIIVTTIIALVMFVLPAALGLGLGPSALLGIGLGLITMTMIAILCIILGSLIGYEKYKSNKFLADKKQINENLEQNKDIIASILKEKEVKTLEGFKKYMQFSVNNNTINKNFKSLLVETIKKNIPDHLNLNNSNVNDKMKAVFAYNMAKFFREKENYEYFFNTILKDLLIAKNPQNPSEIMLIEKLENPSNKLLKYQHVSNLIYSMIYTDKNSTQDNLLTKIVKSTITYFEKENPEFKLDELQKIYDYASAIKSIKRDTQNNITVEFNEEARNHKSEDFKVDLQKAINRKITKKEKIAKENNTTFPVSEDGNIISTFYSKIKILANGQEIARKPQNAIPTEREKSEAVEDMITAKFARMIIKQRAGMYDKPAEVTV